MNEHIDITLHIITPSKSGATNLKVGVNVLEGVGSQCSKNTKIWKGRHDPPPSSYGGAAPDTVSVFPSWGFVIIYDILKYY